MRMPMTHLIIKLPIIVCFFLSASASAVSQHSISAKAGNIQWIKGEVFLGGTALPLRDGHYFQMENNQVLNTRKGYAELLLAPNAFLRLGENSSLRMLQNRLSDIQLELSQGSVLIEILEKLKTDPIQVHFLNSVVKIKKEGLYRLDAGSRKLRVYGGDAETIKGKKKVRVKNGRMFTLDGELKPEKFNADASDALHRWAAQRSFVLFAKNLFSTKPLHPRGLTWRSRPEGIYNPYYRVTLEANEDWNRYWLSVSNVFMDPKPIVLPDGTYIIPDSDGNTTVVD